MDSEELRELHELRIENKELRELREKSDSTTELVLEQRNKAHGEVTAALQARIADLEDQLKKARTENFQEQYEQVLQDRDLVMSGLERMREGIRTANADLADALKAILEEK